MREVVGTLGRYESDAAQDAEDVRVERENLLVAGEEERAGDGLRADAAELREVADGLFVGEGMQEIKVESPVLLFDLPPGGSSSIARSPVSRKSPTGSLKSFSCLTWWTAIT